MWLLRFLCVLVLAAILTAGLWPFLPAKNQVSWTRDRNGIRFGGRGIVYSPAPLRSGPAKTETCAVEIWLKPEAAPERGDLAVFSTSNAYFSLHQEKFALGVRLHNPSNLGGITHRHIKDVFHPGEPVLIAISSDGKTTKVFVDGILTQSLNLPLAAWNLHGEFQSRDWKGQLFGVASYQRALSPAEVSRHRQAWASSGRPEPSSGGEILAMYLFDERSGRLIHNRAGSGADLYIPARYMEPHRTLLNTVPPKLSEWRDILLNISGFVPLGFLFCAYISLRRSPAFSALVTILIGFGISLGIEVSQSFFPERNSDVVDIVTNTLGTIAGVLLYRIPRVSMGLARLGLPMPSRGIAPQGSDPRPR